MGRWDQEFRSGGVHASSLILVQVTKVYKQVLSGSCRPQGEADVVLLFQVEKQFRGGLLSPAALSAAFPSV